MTTKGWHYSVYKNGHVIKTTRDFEEAEEYVFSINSMLMRSGDIGYTSYYINLDDAPIYEIILEEDWTE